jgi:hypothetical protein
VVIWVDEPLAIEPGESPADVTQRLAARMQTLVEKVVADYPDRPQEGDDWWYPAYAGGGAPTPEEAAAAEHESIRGKARLPGEQSQTGRP